jgi:HK97 family phage major capsid protein
MDFIQRDLVRKIKNLSTHLDTPQRDEPRLDLPTMLVDLANGVVHGESREALQENARRAGQHFDSQRPIIEFRDLQKAVSSAGGFLVGTELQEPVDILRQWSITNQAGLQIDTGLVGDQAVPKVTAKSTPNWLNTEAATLTPSTPSIVQIALAPKMVGGTINFSRQFSKQTNANRFVGNELLRTIGTAIDQAVVNGSGASAQPLGILNTTGVQTQSGTNLNAGCATMKRKAAEANVSDDGISFLSTPAVRELLEGREKATGGGNFVWQKDLVADRPARVTTDMPTATMLCGDFSLVYLGIWGQGFTLEINPYDPTGFKQGIIQARILVACDLAVRHPSAFIAATSIT